MDKNSILLSITFLTSNTEAVCCSWSFAVPYRWLLPYHPLCGVRCKRCKNLTPIVLLPRQACEKCMNVCDKENIALTLYQNVRTCTRTFSPPQLAMAPECSSRLRRFGKQLLDYPFSCAHRRGKRRGEFQFPYQLRCLVLILRWVVLVRLRSSNKRASHEQLRRGSHPSIKGHGWTIFLTDLNEKNSEGDARSQRQNDLCRDNFARTYYEQYWKTIAQNDSLFTILAPF